MPNYIYWTKHEETRVLENEEEDDDTILRYAQYSSFAYALMDEAKEPKENDTLAQMLHDEVKDCSNEKVR